MRPVPHITSIAPASIDANTTSFTLTITGTNFDASSLAYWYGSPLPTVVVSQTQITATVAPTSVPTGGVYQVQVFTPETVPEQYDGGLSNIINFTAALDPTTAAELVCNQIDDYRKVYVNQFFTYAGTQWSCDYESTRNLMGVNILSILNGGNLPPGVTWRDAHNTDHPNVTGAFMGGMASSMLKFGMICYQVAWYHKGVVRTLTSTEAIFAYDYHSVGWPDPNVQQ